MKLKVITKFQKLYNQDKHHSEMPAMTLNFITEVKQMFQVLQINLQPKLETQMQWSDQILLQTQDNLWRHGANNMLHMAYQMCYNHECKRDKLTLIKHFIMSAMTALYKKPSIPKMNISTLVPTSLVSGWVTLSIKN